MSDMDTIIHDAMRQSRDAGALLVIELFEYCVDQGMCADCCLREVKKFLETTSFKPPLSLQ